MTPGCWLFVLQPRDRPCNQTRLKALELALARSVPASHQLLLRVAMVVWVSPSPSAPC